MTAIYAHREMLTSNYCNIFQSVKKYGNVMSLDFGIMSSVVISSLPLIKEAFSHLDENFINRPIFPLQKHIFNENGKSFVCCKICIVIFMVCKDRYMPYLSNRPINQSFHEILLGFPWKLDATFLEWKHLSDDLYWVLVETGQNHLFCKTPSRCLIGSNQGTQSPPGTMCTPFHFPTATFYPRKMDISQYLPHLHFT